MTAKSQKTKSYFIRYGVISLCTLLTANLSLLLVSCNSSVQAGSAPVVNNTAPAKSSFKISSENNQSTGVIFVSESTTTGNILASVESIFVGTAYPNDIVAADALCTQDSQCTSGYCQAMISDGQNRISPSWQGNVYNYGTDWVLESNTSYYNTSYQFIGKTNWSQIIINESSEQPYFTNPVLPNSNELIWTGMNEGWDTSFYNCNGFGATNGYLAQTALAGGLTVDKLALTCDQSAHLYCVENQITFSNNTWVSGSNTLNQPGIYGIKGTESSSNVPGARDGSISFVDHLGNLWLFGGRGYNSLGNTAWKLNDLWEYNIQNNSWTWVSGSNTVNQPGIYGIKGTESSSNVPGARSGSISFVDKSGNLWLFGGNEDPVSGSLEGLNDLWKYNIQTNSWTWVNGSSSINESGIYGLLGESSTSNTPGARSGSISFVDESGNLWLFGGLGYDQNGYFGYLNDLWKYNIQSNSWTWVSGLNFVDQFGVYGERGTESSSNIPGARFGSISFVDNSGNLWLFGGFGYDKNGDTGYLNDLWKYNIQTNSWTWINGSNIRGQSGVYGTLGFSNENNIPGARFGSISFVDNSGNLWLFGGNGHDAYGSLGDLNDLWKYNIQSNSWTWVSGSRSINQLGIYGTLGEQSTSNIPGARSGSISFVDNSGNLWLFGGNGLGVDENVNNYEGLNDLWKITY